MYLSVHSFLIHPYVGIIQIRFVGRSSQLPLSLYVITRQSIKTIIGNVKHFLRNSFNRGRKGAKKDNCFRSLTIYDYLEKRHMEKVLTEEGKYCILIKSVITEITEQAAVAQ